MPTCIPEIRLEGSKLHPARPTTTILITAGVDSPIIHLLAWSLRSWLLPPEKCHNKRLDTFPEAITQSTGFLALRLTNERKILVERIPGPFAALYERPL